MTPPELPAHVDGGADGQLVGRTIVVCRPAEQAHHLAAALEAYGADVVRLPLVEIAAPADGGNALADAAQRLGEFDWIVFTSANGVRRLIAAVDPGGWPSNTKIAAVGKATAAAVEAAGLRVEFQPREATGRALAEALPLAEEVVDRDDPVRVLAPLAELAGPDVMMVLSERGALVEVVTAYRSSTPEHPEALLDRARRADAVLVTSGSTVDRLVATLGLESVPPVVVAIGPVTADVVRQHGLTPADIADPHDDDGLIAAALRTLGP